MFDFSCSLSHSPCSRVAFFHSSCTKAAVNRGWMIGGLAVIGAEKGAVDRGEDGG